MPTIKKTQTNFHTLIEKILADEPICHIFSQGNTLQIDKKLPYLLVFRHEHVVQDLDIESLVRGESAYLIVQGKHLPEDIQQFLPVLMKRMSAAFGSFLLLDIWLSEDNDDKIVIHYPEKKLTATVEALKGGFDVFSKIHARLEVISAPHDDLTFSPLVDPEIFQQTGSQLIGLEIPLLFTHRESGAAYPVLFRSFKDHFSEVLRKALFDFIRIQTTLHLDSYHVLGRSSVDEDFWEADRRLSNIEHTFDFLLLVSAVNTEQAWAAFKKSKYRKKPVFYYRILNIDPEKLKKEIYDIDLDKIHDPALSFLLRDKRNELDKQFNMLLERNSPDFLYSSIRLYKTIDKPLLHIAEYILQHVKSTGGRERTVPPEYFAEEARKEFAYFKAQDESFAAEVHICDDVPGLLVSRGQLYLTQYTHIRKSRIVSLIQHEVGTHVLTFHNGRKQPMQLLRYGLADYDELQEGLAVLAEYLVGGLDALRMRLLAARVVAASCATQGEPFERTFQLLHEQYGFTKRTAFDIVTRIYQAGGFTKDVIYLRGLLRLLDYLREGGDLEPLFMGKIAVKHIQVMQELRERGILKPPAIKPRYLESQQATDKLEKIKQGIDIKALVIS